MNTTILVLQILVALAFLMAGITKALQPIAKLAKAMPWVNEYPASTVRFIAISEILGGIGVLFPYLTNIAPLLTPLAAGALALVMALAAAHHLRRKEYKEAGMNAVLFILCIIIAFYRYQVFH
jgi:uncharacterized membrane protein YphA (DoxX/SURF4 family)